MALWSKLSRRGAVITASGGVAFALAALAQTTLSHPTSSGAPDYPPPYDNSKADRELEAFDKTHPQCRLWTDWHKLCSRTGPAGSTYCRTDPEHQAEPSTPFCADQENFGAARISELRYTGHRPRALRDSDDINWSGMYRPNRPFNGSRFSEWANPACQVWTMKVHDKFEDCAADNRKNLPSCQARRFAEAKFTQRTEISCKIFRDFCPKFQSLFADQRQLDGVDSNVAPVVIGSSRYALTDYPVHGLDTDGCSQKR